MWTLRFWQSWTKQNKLFLFITSLLFVAAIIYMWVSYAYTPAPAIKLQTILEPEIQEIGVSQFQKGPFDFTVRGNNYVIFQRQLGSMLETDVTVAYAYALFVAIFVIGMLAIISTLSRFYYLVGMGLFILLVVSISPEVLGVLGQYGKTFTIIVLALYCLPSFYIFYFKTSTSFAVRTGVFAAITLLTWAIIYFFAATPLPFLFIGTYAAEVGLIASALFIITVSHEIVAGFLYAVSQGNRKSKSLNHFLIITTIYLINLVLAYCIRFDYLRWDLITVDLYLLLTISAVLGFWGLRQRGKLFEGIIDTDPYALYAFLLTGMLTFATIGMFMNNGNDGALAAILDIVIFSHLGFGALFVLYTLSNFIGMLGQNLAVYRVMYQPNNMSFFIFRFAGLIATVSFVIYNVWQVPVHNAIGGYYNGIANLYTKIGNDKVARVYFEEARAYAFGNHHTSYALANIENAAFSFDAEQGYYRDASRFRPTQMSYLNWAQTYQSTGKNPAAISVLMEGAKALDDHASVDNTLGLLFARVGLVDSAKKYIDRSKSGSSFKAMGSSNEIGLMTVGQLPSSNDTVFHSSDDAITLANRLGLLNSFRYKNTSAYKLPSDTVLTLAEAAGINNYLINRNSPGDTTFINKVAELARRPSNDGFKEPLLFASAIAMYNSGETKKAFLLLEEVTYQSDRRGRYNNILALWALENNEPTRALDYADYSMRQNYGPSELTHAAVLTEIAPTGGAWIDSAAFAWDKLSAAQDSITVNLSKRMNRILSMSPNTAVTELSDEDKYAFARYRYSTTDSSAIYGMVAAVQNDDIKARMLLELAERHAAQDHPGSALHVLAKIGGLELTDRAIGERMRILEMLARVQSGQSTAVLEALQQEPIAFAGKDKKYKIYFEALRASAANDSTAGKKLFGWLGQQPFFEDGIIAAAEYFRGKGLTSYQIISDGVLYHPSSIRIRKAYAIESARSGLDEYAVAALQDLKSLISASDYAKLASKVGRLIAERSED